jgi:hypothetical protein
VLAQTVDSRMDVPLNQHRHELNLSFMKKGALPESTSSMDLVHCTRISQPLAKKLIPSYATCQFYERMPQVASTGIKVSCRLQRWFPPYCASVASYPVNRPVVHNEGLSVLTLVKIREQEKGRDLLSELRVYESSLCSFLILYTANIGLWGQSPRMITDHLL